MRLDRRTLIAASAMSAGLAALDRTAGAADEMADFLFVQSAKGMTFDPAANKLTLEGVSPVTFMFADRPERIAGNMRTVAFVPFWNKGKDSFLSDPPNADLSIIEGETLRQVIVTIKDPVLEGDRLSYTATVLEGDMPKSGSDVSLFIDIIGMPLTPLSFAGARRRFYRRAFLY
jgi:hypothetical protein